MLSGDRQIRVPNDPKERQLYYETIQALIKRLSNLAEDFEDKLRKGMEVRGWTVSKVKDKGNTTVASVPELAEFLEEVHGISKGDFVKMITLPVSAVGKLLEWRKCDWQKEWRDIVYKCTQCKGKGFRRVSDGDDFKEISCSWCNGDGVRPLLKTAPPPKPRVIRQKDATPIPDEFFEPIIDVDIDGNTKG